MRKEAVLVLAISLVLLIPCFWHAHIQAGDLASHVYNAWLAQLASQGKAPGVYVVWQWDNVLFDFLLLNVARIFGFNLAEKVAVSLCVLVFFWGVFTLASVSSGRRPWFLAPGLAMLAYGYVFHMGFLNYYLSIGLACFGLAAIWKGTARWTIVAILLAPVALLAHPLGFLFLVTAGAYRLVWPWLRGWMEWLPVTAAAIVGGAVHFVVDRHPQWYPDWPDRPLLFWNGADQFWIFRPETRYVVAAALLFAVVATLLDVLPRKRGAENWRERRLWLQFYGSAVCLALLLPESIRPNANDGWIGMLVSRLTLISAIFALCWLATLRPRRWHIAALGACALVFFTCVYRDTAMFERLESNARAITRQLPFGTRVLASIAEPDDYRTGTLHVVDRACIGHCFVYSNYEASTSQFRVRVKEGSPVVTASIDDSEDMQFGSYDVVEDDLPLKQIYQCDARDWTKLCMRDLHAGEKNGSGAAIKPH